MLFSQFITTDISVEPEGAAIGWIMVNSKHDNRDPFNTDRPVVHKLNLFQKALFYPAAWLIWLYYRSLRMQTDPTEKKLLKRTSPPRMIIMWHNRSLLACEVIRRLLIPERVAALISPSRIAAWEVALFEFMKMRVIRGSTTRRSIQAGMEILRVMKEGDDAGISPDGPSGPLYSFQPGATALARKAKVPVVMLVPNCRSARRLNTWDRHLIPYPFARIQVRIRIIHPEDPVWDLPADAISEELRRVCLEMTEDPF